MPSRLQQGFLLGPWRVEPLAGTLGDPDGESIRLEPKVMDALVVLAEQAGDVVSRDKLVEAVWNGNHVSDERLRHVIADLRRALGDDRGDPKYIQTIPKRGYRVIGQIRLPEDASARTERNTFRRSMAYVMAAAIVVSLIYVSYTRFAIDDLRDDAASSSVRVAATDQTDRWETSIAVLPFVNMSDDPDYEYFSDGLSEEILNLLTNIPGVKVIGRTSSFSFKGKNEDIRVIGETLGVETLLEGSVRVSGDRVRITVQLVAVSDGSHIWSETYDRTVTDIFAVQDDVAAAVFDALQIHVGDAPTRGRPTENSEAYALFLKARSSMGTSDYRYAKELLFQAIEIDPKFAEAYELLAANYFHLAGEEINAAEGQKLVGEAAGKALAIDPDLIFAGALYRMGDIENWSFAREIELLERAAREQPSNLQLLYQLSWDLFVAGYLREALDIAKRHADLDPLSPAANVRLADALYAVGNTSEAIAVLELQVRLGNDDAKWNLGVIDLIANRDDIAIANLEAWQRYRGASDPIWVREWVTGARNPVNGQPYLDSNIAEIVASSPDNAVWHRQPPMADWYLYFGYLDRYLALILETDLTDSAWDDAELNIKIGIQFRRLGFTAHPKYLEVAESVGFVDVWEQRGPPDFCEKSNGKWICE